MSASLSHIAQCLGADLRDDMNITTLLTDSRSLSEAEGTLFFAIATRGNDGHRYIRSLYDAGVRAFVVTRIPSEMKNMADARFLVVPDVIEALQKVAARGERFGGLILAITGSRGKTTLKEWIYQLMEPLANISRSPRSFNSQIGVPLSMWQLDPSARLGIIEAGISHAGEMKALAGCICPDAVIITNIGDAHAEGFDSIAQKAREKVSLAAAPGVKVVIYSLDDPLLRQTVADLVPDVPHFGWSRHNPEAEVYISAVSPKDTTTEVDYVYDGNNYRLTLPFVTERDADIENVANALSFMIWQKIEPEVIAGRFLHLHKIGTRLRVTEGVNDCQIVSDSYTSDFSSLAPALDFTHRRAVPGQSLTLVLADLHHEGGSERSEYERIAELLRHSGVNRLIGVGHNMCRHRDLFDVESLFYETTGEMLDQLSISDFSNEIILLKGSPEYDLSGLAQRLEARTHETVLEVNLDAVVANYNYFRSHLEPTTGIVCMVKASGYGAGSYEIAKTLQDAGARYLAVAVLDEGIDLRNQGITMPIMVMNPRVANYGSMFANSLEPEIYAFDMLADVIYQAERRGIRHYPIHIKIDTGMHRMGFVESELAELCRRLSLTDAVEVRSVFSHLATADCVDMDEYTLGQLDCFDRCSAYVAAHCKNKVLRHVLNSAGILRFPQYQYDMVRLGIGLYGANTLPQSIEAPLAVVSTLRTVIIAVNEREAGEAVGYGRMGLLTRKSRIATIPIGYADGMNRHFGRGAIKVLVNGHAAPTVGNICMDACMIDVTGIDCNVGDSVEIFGRNADVQRLADVLDTIPYEILTSVSPRVKRVYFRE